MDPARPRGSEVALRDGRIAAIGAPGELDGLRGPGTEIIDAAGGTVLPGICEAHMHLFAGAVARTLLDLGPIEGFDALAGALRAYAAERPADGLLLANHCNYTILAEGLTRHHLDRILQDRPCLLIAPDYHTGWANTVALERAGILRGGAVGAGSEIVIGADGLATGELREGEAMAPIQALRTSGGRERLGLYGLEPEGLSAADRAEDAAFLADGLAYAASHGITTIQNMDGNRYQLDLLAGLEAEGRLLCRTEIPFHLTRPKALETLAEWQDATGGIASDTLSAQRVKMFMDGVLDSGTAVRLDDYPDRPGWKGEPIFSQMHFDAAAIEADRLGLQISVHAIGDGAVRMVLDGYQAAQDANGAHDSRHRIEHIELIDPADIPRFARLGVIASMQPAHPPGLGFPREPTLSKIGRARWADAYAWRRLKDAGARLIFATDWPVAPLPPLPSIQAALTRQPWGDEPDQRLTLDETLAAYTSEGAYAWFREDRLGRLAPGYHADLVILSGDIEAVRPEAIDTLSVRRTLMDGRTTWAA